MNDHGKIKPVHRKMPEGTEEEHRDAFLKATDTRIRLLDYHLSEDHDEEKLSFIKRFFYYMMHGPRKGYYGTSKTTKLTQSDVLYILSVKWSSKQLAKYFGVTEDLIASIRKGNNPAWIVEYRLVKRLIYKLVHEKRLNRYVKPEACYIQNIKTGEVIAICSGERVAKEYLRNYLVFRKKIPAKEVDNKFKNKTIFLEYKLQKEIVISRKQ